MEKTSKWRVESYESDQEYHRFIQNVLATTDFPFN